MLSVKKVIASVSGKGGTGKSALAANIAYALRQKGKEVGILDCDVRSPNITCILGIDSNIKLEITPDRKRIVRPLWNDIFVMSSAIVVSNYRAMTITGEQVSTFLRQTIIDYEWPKELDYLVLDMDPSSGDSMKSVHEMFKGKLEFIIISSSDVSSLSDCRRMIKACEQKRPPIPIIGIVANMIGSQCPTCMGEIVCRNCGVPISFGDEDKVFWLAKDEGIPYLGGIRFNPAIKEQTDHGNPILPDRIVIEKIMEKIDAPNRSPEKVP